MVRSESTATNTIRIVKPDGSTCGPFKASFSKNIIRVFGQEMEVDDGDSLERPLTDGATEIYTVEKASFVRGMTVYLDNWKMIVSNGTSRQTQASDRKSAGTKKNNAPQSRIGNFDAQLVRSVFRSLIEAIDEAAASPEEKAEARLRLKAFLDHHVVAASLGVDAEGWVTAPSK